MHDLTQRQIQILKSLIEEYIETAEAVGSETLEKKHNLAASPATIRNEMVALEKKGYLKKPHTSAGRVPTPMAMKFYVKQLMKTQDLSVAEEVRLKERIWDFREKEAQCLHMMVKSLAEKTKALAIVTTDTGDMYAAGYANILDMPEFFDIDITKSLLIALDEFSVFRDMFATVTQDEEVHILLEDELGPTLHGPYGVVFTNYHTPLSSNGQIGILGPTRLNYTSVIPVVKYFGSLVEEIAKGW